MLAVAVNAAALFAQAAPGERDLAQLRERIAELQRSLDEKTAERDEARDALRESERAISEANRTLAALSLESNQLKVESARLAERRRVLERTLAGRRGAVEAVLRARQGLAAPELVRAALSGDDPGQLARRLQYIAYLSRAAAELIATHRAELAALAALEREAEVKRARLAAVEQASRDDRGRILRERAARRRVLGRLGQELRASRRQISVLRADEGRLARLVEGLGRALARVEAVPDTALQTQAFSRLRGKLRLPVRGELTGRYGAPRGASGIEAKGVFIRAPQGAPVRAVAGGQVVYADWMRGFGNLMIVDHGENYLSIYANADSLLKQVGDVVRPGEPLATAGASGGNEETGLYFELRHLGRAFDPLGWVTLK
ncbi:MAG TPA: peptidoglycan DD-metalloendopeptidase family protein [Burkholderiales bacterium]|nr:peptidoglycan DD-metalloendopeptidase family protein [Burkholderiales bacterium]